MQWHGQTKKERVNLAEIARKSSDPKVWTCDVEIPSNAGLIDGDYKLFEVNIGTREFGQSYTEDFHPRKLRIQNPDTFTPPSKVTVTERP